MTQVRQSAKWTVEEIISFLKLVWQSFNRNNGFLLSGAVAYYTLLSLVPLSLLVLTVLSHVVDREQLVHTLATYLEMVVPGYAALIIEQLHKFLAHRQVIGLIGFVFMLFFSSMAFTTLEKAISAIFYPHVRVSRRTFISSVLIPYLYIGFMGAGLAVVSIIAGALETLEHREMVIFGLSLSLAGTTGVVLYILGIIGEFLMHTSLYMVMPVVRVTSRYALIGGVSCTVLWEISRRLLVWYYSSLSMVNIIYGSIATVVVALLCIEVVVVILLLGAQVIVELERRNRAWSGDERSAFDQ
jgi:membrane protein